MRYIFLVPRDHVAWQQSAFLFGPLCNSYRATNRLMLHTVFFLLPVDTQSLNQTTVDVEDIRYRVPSRLSVAEAKLASPRLSVPLRAFP